MGLSYRAVTTAGRGSWEESPGALLAVVNAFIEAPVQCDSTVKSRSEDSHMNWDTIAGNWSELKGKIKESWGKLTDDELDCKARPSG